MRRSIKFPALMAALPPRHRNPKIAVCAFDTEIEIPELSSLDAPLALKVQEPRRNVEYRAVGDRLMVSTHSDPTRFFERYGQQFLDSRRHNGMTGRIMRDMYRAVEKINDYEKDKFWPQEALHHLRSGMNSEWQLFKDIVGQSQSLQIDGDWRAKLPTMTHMAFLADEHPQDRLRRYEAITQEATAGFALIDGMVWRTVPEPVYVLRMKDGGFDYSFVSDIGRYHEKPDGTEEMSWYTDLSRSAYRLSDGEELAERVSVNASPLPAVEIFMPETLTADIASLEMDRVARVLVDRFSENLAKRAPQDYGRELSLPSSSLACAWSALADFTGSYQPLDGVPEEVEDEVLSFLGAFRSGDENLLSDTDRQNVHLHLERWSERPVTIEASLPIRMSL